MVGTIANSDRRILVVDDDEAIRRLVCAALQYEKYQVREADSGEAALASMGSWSPHLVLLDVNMPRLNGLETLRKLRDRDDYVSVIFVSGESKHSDVIRGLDSGAGDYVTKPFDVEELMARVRAQLRIKDLNDRLKRANDRLKELVDIDDLTGLFNMRSVYQKLDLELERARRFNRSVCVLMMDLDHFKKVNDSNDHLFGSFVLSQVGRMIRETIRKVDIAARYGGDEFLIALSEISEDGAKNFGERLRAKIEATHFANESYEIDLTASIGLAVVNPQVVQIDARQLVRLADRALYQAKEKGRNRVEVAPVSP